MPYAVNTCYCNNSKLFAGANNETTPFGIFSSVMILFIFYFRTFTS